MSGLPAAADGPTFIVWRIVVNCAPLGFELSGLKMDIFGPQLTNSYNRRVRRGETGCGGRTGAHAWPAMANAETNGEAENTRNHGQYGTCRRTDAVNELLVSHCIEGVWLLR